MEIFDITRPLGPRTAVWPGDAPFRLEWTARLSEGSVVNLSCTHGSPHVGTHADSPAHVLPDGASIDQLDLAAYLGLARVVDAEIGSGGTIRPAWETWSPVNESPPSRLLFRTGTDPDPFQQPAAFAAFAPETARSFVERGILLLGIDTPSVDPADSEDLPAHKILLLGGVRVLENLDLSRVAPGDYELVALPLPIVGGDASPVRAVLIRR